MTRKQVLFFLALSIVLSSCGAIKGVTNKKMMNKSLSKATMFDSHLTGFALYDPADSTFLYTWNENKYFTPASNTKLLTFYAGLTLLRDSIPGLKYTYKGDSLFFTGTGDPTFLHPDFEDQVIFDLLMDTTYSLHYVKPQFKDEPFAPGWSWEDYEYYFQPERTAFPVYGNTIRYVYDSVGDKFFVEPSFFKDFAEIREIDSEKLSPYRLQNTNIFSFAPDTARSAYKNSVPFKTSDALTVALLEDTLKRRVNWVEDFEFEHSRLAYSRSSMELFAFMLKRSDNLAAEQILYLCATEMRMPLQADPIRFFTQEQNLKIYPNPPIWKDGSGLSRYNLVTPRSMIAVLNYISSEISIEQMKQVLAVGGKDGTLKNWYKPKAGESPYVFAKTGTLSNNHNLTGIIHTKSGKDLFFSFMNNNYASSSRPVKLEMEKVMRLIYEKY
ncbi:D-alanyl-D-alanine carboxypeptidase/D-alanyl-D-alanine-endopeptidase [Reichenbachiella sp.]|uniref:D-alanyl-D-alanine carboxypeptidase/D-alanyl-D-alanine-endopeptidase n=1 Tax=Reichenbachiella sp. TaxID=2184521 RepID=UPI003B5CD021